MAKFKAGSKVKQIVPAPIEGVVKRFILDEASGDIIYIVADESGHESSFHEDKIEAVEAPEAAE